MHVNAPLIIEIILMEIIGLVHAKEIKNRRSFHDVVSNVLDCNIVVKEF